MMRVEVFQICPDLDYTTKLKEHHHQTRWAADEFCHTLSRAVQRNIHPTKQVIVGSALFLGGGTVAS